MFLRSETGGEAPKKYLPRSPGGREGRSPLVGDLGGEENWKKKQGPDLSARPLRCNCDAAVTPYLPQRKFSEHPLCRKVLVVVLDHGGYLDVARIFFVVATILTCADFGYHLIADDLA